MNKELVVYLNKLYWVYRKVAHHKIKEGYINDIKDFWRCDMVVKHKSQDTETVLFLREIPDAEIVLD